MTAASFQKILMACAVSAAAALGVAPASATGTTSIHRVANIAPGGRLNIYAKPNLNSRIVKRLKKNDTVYTDDHTYGGVCINAKTGKDHTGNLPAPNVWCEVHSLSMNGKVGWAYSRYLQFIGIQQ
jgi:hypothetical protein